MKKFYTILIAILLILSYVLVYQTGKEKTLDWAIEEQTKIEEKHIFLNLLKLQTIGNIK